MGGYGALRAWGPARFARGAGDLGITRRRFLDFKRVSPAGSLGDAALENGKARVVSEEREQIARSGEIAVPGHAAKAGTAGGFQGMSGDQTMTANTGDKLASPMQMRTARRR